MLRMVQKQHGELLHGLIGRFRSNAAKGNAPLVSSPFSEYESQKLFDDKLTGQMKDTLVSALRLCVVCVLISEGHLMSSFQH